MKQYKLFLFITLVLLLLFSCDFNKNQIKVNPGIKLNAQISKLNSDSNFTSTVNYIEEISKRSYWFAHDSGKVRLSREVIYEATLENGENIELSFWLSKIESDTTLLLLSNESIYDDEEKQWKYKYVEDEINNFYKNFNEARIIVEKNTVVFYQKSDPEFEIEKSEKALVNSKEKTFLKISFSGKATGWFDPNGEFIPYYILEDGFFEGVLE